jgi:tetrahydromethanopterin S-methyltransferase subunit H
MFEIAVRNKYRFPSGTGQANVEDLWDLSVERLDNIYKKLKSELKQVEEESLLNKVTESDKEIQNKLEIVKYIFTTKTTEKETMFKTKEKSEMKQYLLSIVKQKQNAEYEGKTIEELQQMITNL